jgi:guanylate kinase
VTREEFDALRAAGGFLEWFEVYGDLKGTPAEFVRSRLAAGGDILLEVDVNGALAVKAALPEALLVFVAAPSREEQRRRLEGRGTETPESVVLRLDEAEAEERIAARAFDHVVVNDEVERAVAEISAILSNRRGGEGVL